MKHFATITVLVLFISIPTLALSGGGLDLPWNTYDGGGGTSAGGTLVLRGTIGQPDAETLTGGTLILRGGFWRPYPPPKTTTGGISSRYIQIEPDGSSNDPVALRVECGAATGWVKLVLADYDDGDGVFVNIGVATEPDSTTADFLTADEWTSSGANALYVTGQPVCPSFRLAVAGGPVSKPTVTAQYISSGGPITTSVQPADPTWVYCDSSNDGQVTFFADLFKQFSNTAAAGFPGFTGPDPGIEVDTQGNWPSVPDQQVTFFSDIFACFGATSAGGGATWTGPMCP
ncbi:MAG: hypothetical protein V3W34_01165 [Phycisphaerae bacterium]